jgi:hypothetical protein
MEGDSVMKKKPRVYARIVNLGIIIRWQLTAILIGITVQLAFSWYHHEMTMTKMDGMLDTTVKLYRICSEIGLSDCNEVRKILRD